MHSTVASGLQQLRVAFPRIIIYCQQMSDCGLLHWHIHAFLGKNFTEPENSPDLPQSNNMG